MICRRLLIRCAALAVLLSPAAQTRAEDQTLIPPPGDYKVVELVLENAGHGGPAGAGGIARGKDTVIRGAFRDGKLKLPSRLSVRDITSALTVDATTIRGEAIIQGKPRAFDELRCTIQATVANGRITGAWQKTDKSAKGALSGWVKTESDLQKENAFTTKADWPCWSGPSLSLAATPTGVKLVDDIKDARLAWRGEELVPQANGNALNYSNLAVFDRTMGGGASPVIADGKVFISYYQPAGDEYMTTLSGNPLQPVSGDKFVAAAAAKAGVAASPFMSEKFLVKADDVVVCMDAATGKTLWKTVFAGRSLNQPSHKGGAVNNTPCVGGGKVFAMNPAGTLRALDVATGKLVWERTGMSADRVMAYSGARNMNTAPVYIAETLIHPDHGSTLYGLDPRTGKDLWKLAGASGPLQVPSRWVHDGDEYVISQGDAKILCIEPRTGKVAWELATGKPEGQMALVCGDVMVTLYRDLEAGQKEGVRDLSCRAYRLSLEGAKVLWTIARPNIIHPGGCGAPPAVDARHVFLAGTNEGKLVEAATGKILGTTPLKGGIACQGHLILADGHALTHHDGSHGHNDFNLVRFGDAGPRLLGGAWSPPHPQTTSGDHFTPMVYPVVEGRLFLRGYDGVYCYDLRKTPGRLKAEAALENGKRTEGGAIDRLVALCGDDDPSVRRGAVELLTPRIAEVTADRKQTVFSALARLAGDPDAAVRAAAGEAIAGLGAEAIEVLIPHATGTDVELRISAIQALGRLREVKDPRLDQAFLAALAQNDENLIAASFRAIKARGLAAGHLADSIAALVDSPNANVASQAIDSLLAICPQGQPPAKRPRRLADRLIDILGSDDVELAGRATRMICGLGTEEAIQVFNGILRGDHALRSIRACNGLALLGKPAAGSVPLIREARAKWAASRVFARAADTALATLEKAP
jgi:outer membrane protein assembly factor BamB